MGLYWDNGKYNGNYKSMLGLYTDNGQSIVSVGLYRVQGGGVEFHACALSFGFCRSQV